MNTKYINYDDFELEKSLCCEACDCSIGKDYNRVVLSDGNKTNPTVLIVGEAPGAEEVVQCKPFVGKAGQLLRSTLTKFGITSENSLITNTIPCRPLNNKFPKDDGLVRECVSKWLYNEINITKPPYMLLIGATPTKFLLKLKGITAIRGNWQELVINEHKMVVMSTLHPSYVLRKQYMKEGSIIRQQFEDDIRNVAEKCLN